MGDRGKVMKKFVVSVFSFVPMLAIYAMAWYLLQLAQSMPPEKDNLGLLALSAVLVAVGSWLWICGQMMKGSTRGR